MSDHNIIYNGEFGFSTFERCIREELGEEFWLRLTDGLTLPVMETEPGCQCRNMYQFMERFRTMTDEKTRNVTLSRVRHGLHPAQSAWARDVFLETGDLDLFLQKHYENEMNNFIQLNKNGKDFYGDPVTDEVLAYIRQNPDMISGIRKDNKLYLKALPASIGPYLEACDSKMKRYYSCHCPFAKESILTDTPVSSTLCNCSLGHIKNFWEAVFDRELEGKVLSCALAGDLQCRYSLRIPDDIMEQYVKKQEECHV